MLSLLMILWSELTLFLLLPWVVIASFPAHLFMLPLLLRCSFSASMLHLGRFFEAHLVTSAYRIIATDFLPEDRENAARAVGLTDQCSTTLGSIVSTVLVSRYASC